ncbi:MAG: class III signal peptide-containing protein [Candidatus Anstonellales archaeon]
MKGQLSAEMIILLAVVLAIVAIAANYLLQTAQTSGEAAQNKTTQVIGAMEKTCISDADCKVGKCIKGVCQ